jgi:hypothetical protein
MISHTLRRKFADQDLECYRLVVLDGQHAVLVWKQFWHCRKAGFKHRNGHAASSCSLLPGDRNDDFAVRVLAEEVVDRLGQRT